MRTLMPSLKCPTATAAAAMCSTALSLQLLSAACRFSGRHVPHGLDDGARAPEIAAAHAAGVASPARARCMMLASHASAAISDVERRHEAVTAGSQVPDVLLQIVSSELSDAGGDSTHAAEGAFLINCLSESAARPTLLALPLAMIQRLLDEAAGEPGGAAAGAAGPPLMPPACMQLLAQDSPGAGASSLARSVAEKVVEAHREWVRGGGAPLELQGMQYAASTVALGCRGGTHSALTLPSALISMALRTPAAHSDAAWAPLLLSTAALELRGPAGAASHAAGEGVEAALVQEVQHACSACTVEGLWGCVVAGLAAWWLLGAGAREQVLTAIAARTLSAGQPGSACLSDAFRAIEHMSGSTMSEFLVTQDGLLMHVGMSLADNPQVRSVVKRACMRAGSPQDRMSLLVRGALSWSCIRGTRELIAVLLRR